MVLSEEADGESANSASTLLKCAAASTNNAWPALLKASTRAAHGRLSRRPVHGHDFATTGGRSHGLPVCWTGRNRFGSYLGRTEVWLVNLLPCLANVEHKLDLLPQIFGLALTCASRILQRNAE